MRDVPLALSAALSQRYLIEREIGAGGMATVYLARDLKHERDVALKVLRADVAAAIGVDRFLAEIKTTARLRHPHILPLFDSGSAGAALFYVMPFIDGESLGERIRRSGPLPILDVVRILRQAADALAYAHTRGVIHRDIKPDNVLVSDHHVFLADFGIARAFAAHDPGATRTGTGMGVGTPAYMSPEQVVGGAVDHRTDIYALGAIGYELLTGSPPFSGTAQEQVAAQLTRSPEPVSRRRPDTPPPLAHLIMGCLQKVPDDRPSRADDVVAMLDTIATFDAGSPVSRQTFAKRRVAYIAAALLAALALLAAWYLVHLRRAPPALVIGRIMHVTSEPGLELDPALSPDGRMIAYAAGVPGRTRIYVRERAGGRVVPLTDDSFSGPQRWPQWSPDGSRIVFLTTGPSVGNQRSATAGMGMLYVATPLGGTARKVFISAPDAQAVSPSWSSDGRRIVFGGAEGLYATASEGDGVAHLLAAGSELHSPQWSPDGASIAYVARGAIFTFGAESLGNVETSTVMVLTVATGRVNQITSGNSLDTNPIWMPDGRTLLFVSSRGGGRDVYTIRVMAEGRPEHEPERLTSGLNAHGISIARDGGLLMYSSYAPSANIWSVTIPESGVASVGDAQQVTFGNEKIEKLAVSWDGRWLAYDSDHNGQADIWKLPVAGGRPEQVTRGPHHKLVNDWSPDGRELVFHTMRDGGQRDVFVVSADGTRTEPVTTGPAEEQHSGWGPDGNSIVFDSAPRSGDRNQAYIVTRARPGAPWSAPRQLTKNGSRDPKWSPDGRFIAYCTNGRLRVIAPDGTGDRVLVAAHSSADPEPAYPVWSRDSQTIYYKAYDRERQSTIWGVPVTGGAPRLLVRFDVPARRSLRREFATDGQRFYFTVALDESDLWAMELLPK